MRRLTLALASAVAFLVCLTKPGSATVTFDFFETGITACNAASCQAPQHSSILMSLQLSGPTESGSAAYSLGAAPVVTDPNFAFSLSPFFDAGPTTVITAPDFGRNPVGFITSYDITWSDVGGQLTAVSVNYLDNLNQVGGSLGVFGLTGGGIASDGFIGGCSLGRCTIVGSWQAVPVPEPASAWLLLTALVFIGALHLGPRFKNIRGI
jgi:hypothetical protein